MTPSSIVIVPSVPLPTPIPAMDGGTTDGMIGGDTNTAESVATICPDRSWADFATSSTMRALLVLRTRSSNARTRASR
eukprot:CAMPEP_0185746610 /NCGR_PEP_ID=MMETSP1174-20130828/5224_1 /TAXON_ID=35687 /ORGANISM="Dictyocha speculum, Strain CCMP1381" /LENGTH=77 /DNA_ID=CAMNT_0028421417 /DNA_START=150 /DNA_END=380 /DNA_ORIENTATION=+